MSNDLEGKRWCFEKGIGCFARELLCNSGCFEREINIVLKDLVISYGGKLCLCVVLIRMIILCTHIKLYLLFAWIHHEIMIGKVIMR
jgi:hypothetical protein